MLAVTATGKTTDEAQKLAYDVSKHLGSYALHASLPGLPVSSAFSDMCLALHTWPVVKVEVASSTKIIFLLIFRRWMRLTGLKASAAGTLGGGLLAEASQSYDVYPCLTWRLQLLLEILE